MNYKYTRIDNLSIDDNKSKTGMEDAGQKLYNTLGGLSHSTHASRWGCSNYCLLPARRSFAVQQWDKSTHPFLMFA